jgi:hypothetical protein
MSLVDQRPGPPKFWGDSEEALRKVVLTMVESQQGLSNDWVRVDLVEDEVVTEIVVSYATNGQIALFSPQDPATALEIWATVSDGKVTIHHGAGIGTRTLGVLLRG